MINIRRFIEVLAEAAGMTQEVFERKLWGVSGLLREQWEKEHEKSYYGEYYRTGQDFGFGEDFLGRYAMSDRGAEWEDAEREDVENAEYEAPIMRRFASAAERNATLVGFFVQNDPFNGDGKARVENKRQRQRIWDRNDYKAERLIYGRNSDEETKEKGRLIKEYNKQGSTSPWEIKFAPVQRAEAEKLVKNGFVIEAFVLEAAAAIAPKWRETQEYAKLIADGVIRPQEEAFGFLLQG